MLQVRRKKRNYIKRKTKLNRIRDIRTIKVPAEDDLRASISGGDLRIESVKITV